MEILFALLIGILFLTYGIFDFFIRSKTPRSIRFIIRFIIIFIGIGFTWYAFLMLFGIAPS